MSERSVGNSFAEKYHVGQDWYDVCKWVIYSTLYLKKGVVTEENYNLFGFNWQKDQFLLDTDMDMPNQLPAPCFFEVQGLVVNGSRNRSRKMYNTLATFYDNYGVDLFIGQKSYYKSCMTLFPLNADYQQLYDGDKEIFRKPEDVVFDPELTILTSQYFVLKVQGKPVIPETDAKIVFALRGKMARGVQ